jgi:signal transduction histidine kinase
VKPGRILVAGGACLLVALAGVAWLSVVVLRLERDEAAARTRAAVESGTRLALWRMDAAMSPLLASEGMGRGIPEGLARCRFVVGPSGALDGCDGLRLNGAVLWEIVGGPELLASAGPPRTKAKPTKVDYDYQKRVENVVLVQQNDSVPRAPVEMRAYRVAGELLLLGRAGSLLRGVWLDEDATAAYLLEEIRDLFPRARLVSGEDATAARLASVPLALDPGEPAEVEAGGGVPVRLVLGVAWGGLVAAAGALAILLVGTLALSERRSTFVSAVTHELRTPLTTLRSYAEMLAEGMVPPGKETAYARTLHREAVRLGHLVENVLSFSRLERRPSEGERLRDVTLTALVERARERLTELAAQAGMTLVIGDLGDRVVRTDPDAIEQILYNLVDNAGKYAAAATDRRIEISAGHGGLVVRDHGQGIPAAERRDLFRPFSKSAQRAALSAPGVGLGLALSRRLAREAGGDLHVAPCVGPGAAFALTLQGQALPRKE